MATQAPITPAASAATFDAAQWLSHFESVGGGFLATESQTSLCIACQGITLEKPSAAHAMLRGLTDNQRAAVIAHIRERAGLSTSQPNLKALCSQGFSEPAGISQPSSGLSLGQPEGSQDMDMTHAFTLPSDRARPVDWNAALAEYEAARAWSDSLSEGHGQEDAAVDAYCDAMDHLVKGVRAPSPEALSRKIELSKGRWESMAIPDAWLNAFQADLAAWGQAGDEPDGTADGAQLEPEASASSAYFAELDAVDALGSKLNHLPSAESDRWDKWSMRLWGEIEALPVTPENARLKARAVWSIMGGALEELGDDTTCCRLVRQIIAAMAPALAKATGPRVEWDAAMARYGAAERKMVADKSDEACDVFVDAEYYAMDLPSPDLQALRWKIERLREDAKYSRIGPPSFDRLIGDITRLMGDA